METNKKKSLTELEKEESLLQKILRKITFGVVISLVSLFIAYQSWQTNKTLGKMAAEGREKISTKVDDASTKIENMHKSIVEMEHFKIAVILPDSLERREDVQKLRAFQNDAYSWELAYSSFIQTPPVESEALINAFRYDGMVDLGKNKGIERSIKCIKDWSDDFNTIMNKITNLIGDFSNLYDNILSTSDLSKATMNPWFLVNWINRLSSFNKEFLDVRNKIESIVGSNIYSDEDKLNKLIDVLINNMYKSDNWQDYFQANHEMTLLVIKAINVYLLELKNNN